MNPNAVIRWWRIEAGVSAREAAAACKLHVSSYYAFERDELRGGSDQFGLRVALARLFSARLGREVSPQWDLCGPVPGAARDQVATAPHLSLVTGGKAGPCRAGAVATRSTPTTGDDRGGVATIRAAASRIQPAPVDDAAPVERGGVATLSYRAAGSGGAHGEAS